MRTPDIPEDAVLAYWQEHREQFRQSENQRAADPSGACPTEDLRRHWPVLRPGGPGPGLIVSSSGLRPVQHHSPSQGKEPLPTPPSVAAFLPARGPVLVLDQDAVVDLGDTALRRNAALMSFLVSRPLGAEVSVISTSMPSTPARSR